jgi:hypothetical protein
MKITLNKYFYTFASGKINIFFFCSLAIQRNENCISSCIQTSAENNSFDIL